MEMTTAVRHRDRVRFPGTRSRLARTILISVVVGLLAGCAAKLLETGVAFGSAHVVGRFADPGSATFFRFDLRTLLFPALGGLLSGLIVALLCRRTRAHGTAVLIDAFHHHGAALPLRDSLLKAIAAVLLISLGGAVGKEAPIAVLGAAIGSALAGWLDLAPRERRLYLIAGCAGGVGAIFQCPLGGALFAATVLYREPEIEADAILPAVLSSVTSYSTYMAFGGYGHHLLSGVDHLTFDSPRQLPVYLVLAMACAGVAIAFHYGLRWSARLATASRLPRWLAPAIAGLAGGVLACLVPQVMDARYLFVQRCLDGPGLAAVHPWIIWAALFGAVVVAKGLATSLLMGSESAGGLFGPVLFMGGVTGAAVGSLLELVAPSVFSEPLRQALIPIGMAGLLAASLRTPIAAIVMVMEMTGSYGLIAPLMLVTIVAYVLGRRWGVYAEQIAGPESSPAHAGESIVSLLELWRVGDLAVTESPRIVPSSTPAVRLVAAGAHGIHSFFVVDGKKLVGSIPASALAEASRSADALPLFVALDLAVPSPKVAYTDDDLYSTLDLFRRFDLDALPVVEEASGAFQGLLTRDAILRALREELRGRREQLVQEHSGIAALADASVLEAFLSDLSGSDLGGLTRMPVPEDAIGKSLREIGFRQRYGAEVIGVETAAGVLTTSPDPARPLEKGDILVVFRGKPK